MGCVSIWMTKGHGMIFDLANQYITWIIAFVALVVCWPVAQTFRHKRLHPLAAYLLFVSVLALVSALVFWALLLIISASVGPASLEGVGAAVIIVLLSFVPGFVAAWWIVRRPQVRRMPK